MILNPDNTKLTGITKLLIHLQKLFCGLECIRTSLRRSREESGSRGANELPVSRSDALPLSSDVPAS